MLAGCDDPQVHAYDAPKDPPPGAKRAAKAQGAKAGEPKAGETRPGAQVGAAPISWTLPEGWRQLGEGRGMRYATLAVGSGEEELQIAVTQFPGDVGGLLANINRWRDQVGLGAIDREAMMTKLEAGQEIKASRADGRPAVILEAQGPKGSVLAASISGPGGRTWFLKGIGKPEVVRRHRAGFDALLESVRFGAAAEVEPGEEPSEGPPTLTLPDKPLRMHAWAEPEGWTRDVSPKPMLAARYTRGEGDQALELTVSALPGNGGGLLPNINRWRGQLGLPPIREDDEPSMRELLKPENLINVADGRGLLVEMSSEAFDAALRRKVLVLLAPRREEIWFIKMTGPEKEVDGQRQGLALWMRSFKLRESSGLPAASGATQVAPAPVGPAPTTSTTPPAPVDPSPERGQP
jgi:hypothetical protein